MSLRFLSIFIMGCTLLSDGSSGAQVPQPILLSHWEIWEFAGLIEIGRQGNYIALELARVKNGDVIKRWDLQVEPGPWLPGEGKVSVTIGRKHDTLGYVVCIFDQLVDFRRFPEEGPPIFSYVGSIRTRNRNTTIDDMIPIAVSFRKTPSDTQIGTSNEPDMFDAEVCIKAAEASGDYVVLLFKGFPTREALDAHKKNREANQRPDGTPGESSPSKLSQVPVVPHP